MSGYIQNPAEAGDDANGDGHIMYNTPHFCLGFTKESYYSYVRWIISC